MAPDGPERKPDRDGSLASFFHLAQETFRRLWDNPQDAIWDQAEEE